MSTQNGGFMRFVGVREFRGAIAGIWGELEKEQEIVITSNGKPVSLLVAVNEENFESALKTLRRARAMDALDALHKQALSSGLDKLSLDDINREIKSVRRARK